MTSLVRWSLPPRNVSIQRRAVHVWAWDVKCSSDQLHRYISLLSPCEQFRMQKFLCETHRIRYAISHGILRTLLGHYLAVNPSSISFSQEKYGKPRLSPALVQSELDFNLSHTNCLGLLAVAAGLSVGVDVEDLSPIETTVAEHHFSAQERADNCWTRKEAILKAEGLGLTVSLGSFDVTLRPGAEARLIGFQPMEGLTKSWHLTHLRPTRRSIGALATSDAPSGVECYRFTI